MTSVKQQPPSTAKSSMEEFEVQLVASRSVSREELARIALRSFDTVYFPDVCASAPFSSMTKLAFRKETVHGDFILVRRNDCFCMANCHLDR